MGHIIKHSVWIVLSFLIGVIFVAKTQAATLASASDTITTSRPSASAPLVNDYATALPSYSGNSMNGPIGIAVVGSQVWVTNSATNTISLFNFNGTSAGSALSGNGLNGPLNIAVVGSQVWVVNSGNTTISLFNFNGTSAGSALSGNGMNGPEGIAVVGSQVWVANNSNNTISLFNTDGTSAGSALSGNGLSGQKGIAVVGSQVWIANDGNDTISLFNFNGTSAGSALSGNGLSAPQGIAVVGSQVWVANYGPKTISVWNTPTTQVTYVDNGSFYLASDSATMQADTGETIDTGLNVATMSAANNPSAGQRQVYFANTVSHSHHKGDAVYVPITAMHTIKFTTITAIPTLGKITLTFPPLSTGDSNLAASPSASTFQLNGLSAMSRSMGFQELRHLPASTQTQVTVHRLPSLLPSPEQPRYQQIPQ